MSFQLSYHSHVQRCLATVLVALVAVPVAMSQNAPNHASVPHPAGIARVPRSGPRIRTADGFGQPDPTFFGFPKCCINGKFPVSPSNSPFFNRPFFGNGFRHRRFFPFPGGLPVYAVPYYPPDIVDPLDYSMDQTYGPGPTIFDRRGSYRDSLDYERNYDERLSRLERAMDEGDASSRLAHPPSPASLAVDQPSTVLVYRDGHSIEIKNYAIVGDLLYDFSSDHRRKIPLSNLDLTATQKQNDDRGVDFRLPSRTSGN